MAGRVWALISVEAPNLQYGGNAGYSDATGKSYAFDSMVPNCKQIGVGDLVLIRDKSKLLGVGIVERIENHESKKIIRRCPQCKTTGIKTRKTINPPWRCNNNHVFLQPLEDSKDVTQFVAHFESSYVDSVEKIAAESIKRLALRPSDQISIEELDLKGVATLLAKNEYVVNSLLPLVIDSCGVDEGIAHPIGVEEPIGEYELSDFDRREAIIRNIRARKGQNKFRNRLIRKYGGGCMLTGCGLLAAVEAAHIWPYRGDNDHHIENGILLRADLHTLFDLGLLGIDPAGVIARFHPDAIANGYAEWDGRALKALNGTELQLSRKALSMKWKAFGLRFYKEAS